LQSRRNHINPINTFIVIILFYTLLVCQSCSGTRKITAYLLKESNIVNLNNQSQDTISITYSGCGGFLIKNNRSALLIDPYFSNTGPIPFLYFKKVQSDTAQIDRFYGNHFLDSKDHSGIIKGILVAHSHYDHLADVPSVYSRICNADSTRIYGSQTTKHILASVGLAEKVETIVLEANNKKTNLRESTWIYTENKEIRFLPIPSEHAPHFWGKKMIPSGTFSNDLQKYPRRIRGFPEGNSYNFLIDFLDKKGAIKFRILSHAGAACDSDKGLPSNEVLYEKEIDVLLLCVGNFNQVIDYPEIVIGRVRPKFIIANHWENFFRSYEKNLTDPKTIPGTDVDKFIKKVNHRVADLGLQDSLQLKLPYPGQTLQFNY